MIHHFYISPAAATTGGALALCYPFTCSRVCSIVHHRSIHTQQSSKAIDAISPIVLSSWLPKEQQRARILSRQALHSVAMIVYTRCVQDRLAPLRSGVEMLWKKKPRIVLLSLSLVRCACVMREMVLCCCSSSSFVMECAHVPPLHSAFMIQNGRFAFPKRGIVGGRDGRGASGWL